MGKKNKLKVPRELSRRTADEWEQNIRKNVRWSSRSKVANVVWWDMVGYKVFQTNQFFRKHLDDMRDCGQVAMANGLRAVGYDEDMINIKVGNAKLLRRQTEVKRETTYKRKFD